MARTVADVQALFEIMQGPDEGDPCAAPVPLRKYSREEIRTVGIAYFEDDGRTPVTAATGASVTVNVPSGAIGPDAVAPSGPCRTTEPQITGLPW